MSHRRGLLCLVAVLALGFGASSARAAATSGYIVLYKDSVQKPGAATDRREDRLGFRARHRYSRVGKGFAARLTADEAAELRADPNVAVVAPDLPVRLTALSAVAAGDDVTPGVRRVGSTPSATQVRGAASVGVAVIDTGVTNVNGDINIAGGTNCVNDGGSTTDGQGHGTHVAGTIAARNNGAGVVGVAPDTPIYSVRVFPVSGDAVWSDALCGMQWVATNAGTLNIKVANMSFGNACPIVAADANGCAALRTSIQQALQALQSAGVTPVVAAGNDGGSFADFVPALFTEALTVTAMGDFDGVAGGSNTYCDEDGSSSFDSAVDTREDYYAPFSNYATTTAAQSHTIAAPGSCVESDLYTGGTTLMSGTSMASPHAAGVAALCFGENGGSGPCTGLTPSQAIAQLRATAQAHATATNGFTGDPFSPIAGRYYGNLAWASAPSVTTSAATGIGTGTATLNGSVNPVGFATTYHFEYGTSQSLGTSVGAGNAGSGQSAQTVGFTLTGLSPGTTYWYRLVATPTVGGTWTGTLQSFTTTASAPVPATDSATSVTATGATLNGTVDPSGFATSWHFEYRVTGTTTWTSTATQGPSSASSAQTASATVSGLAPSTPYDFRIVATRATGGPWNGSTQQFTTSAPPPPAPSDPVVTTGTATAISTSGATLNATVDPSGTATSWHFEYGTSPGSLDQSTPTASAGSGSGGQALSVALTGLSASTTYYFRIVATRASGGPWAGSTASFATGAEAVVQPPAGEQQGDQASSQTQTSAAAQDSPAAPAAVAPVAESLAQPSLTLSHATTKPSTSLSLTRAKSLLKSYVRGRLGKGVKALTSKCARSTTSQVRCSVSWRTAKERYSGTFVARLAVIKGRLVTTRRFDGKRTRTACLAAAKKSCRASTVRWR